MDYKKLSKKCIPGWLMIALLVLSYLGFMDAFYLTVKHFTGSALQCSVFDGCDAVTSSKYAEILGIPLALLGALYYLGIFFGAILLHTTKNRTIAILLSFATILGFLTSIVLVYLQAIVLEQYCEYCMLSALSSTLIFILGMILFRKIKKAHKPEEE